jgi:DNA-binding NarL/FixJ family response regulator
MAAPAEISVMIADDQPLVRTGLRDLLSRIEEVRVVGEAGSGRDAIELALHHRPDVLLMGLPVHEADGIAATRHIVSVAPEIGVLVLTMADEDDSVLSAVRAGARGFLLKSAPPEQIAQAVRGVATGAAYFGRSVAGRIADLLTAPAPGKALPSLTQRELDVLDLIATGLNNVTIARRLQLAPKTISNHISNIFAKLSVTGRPEAILRAKAAGLGRRTDPGS